MADLIETINEAIKTVCQLNHSESGIDIIVVNGIRFIEVDIKCQSKIDLAAVRKILLEGTPTNRETRIIQVIGDSGTPISSEKVSFVQQLLDRYTTKEAVIQYGFTRLERDANWLAESLAVRNPALRPRLIGNVVQESIDSIGSGGWTAFSQIKHLVLVYRRGDPRTTFGDDMWVSDGVMTSETGDMMICLEGGPQALRQCVNVLITNVKICVVTGLREGDAVKRFSAAGLFAYVTQNGLSEQTANAYLTQYPPNSDLARERIREDVQRLLKSGLELGSDTDRDLIEICSA